MNINAYIAKISRSFFFMMVLAGVLISMKYALHQFLDGFRYAGAFDWSFFVDAAHNFISKGKVYDEKLANFYPGAPIYKFPPFLVSVLVALAENGISDETVRYGFAVLHLVIYLACALILGGLSANENKWLLAAFIVIFIATYESFIVNFYRLQLEIFVLFFLVVAAQLVIKQKNIMAGACIGFLAAIKIYPVFFAVYFLFEKRTRYFIGAAIGIFISLLFSLNVVGYSEHHRYFVEILPVLLKEEIYTSPENVSAGALLMQCSLSQKMAIFSGNCILLAGILIVFCGYLKARSDVWYQRETVLLAFSVLISTFVLGTKNTWWNYQLLLMFPVIVGMGLSLSQKYKDPVSIAMILIACLCIYANNSARLSPVINVSYGPLIPGFMATFLVMITSTRLYLRATGVYGQRVVPIAS